MRKLVGILLFFSVLGCTKEISPSEKIEKKNIAVTMLSYSDSRCPENVNCIWEGEGLATFLVENDDAEKDTIVLKIGESEDVFGHTIELLDLKPYPVDELDDNQNPNKTAELKIN